MEKLIILFPLIFVLGLTCSSKEPQENQLSAAQVIKRIKQNIGVPWHEPTVDVFKAGDSSAMVTGIAVTMMGTLDVLQRAAAKGENLIITHEPVFYSHLDSKDALEDNHDPVFEAKQAFIKEHHLIIWRFHDHMHAMKPDMERTGTLHALGWEKFQDQEDENVFHIPRTTLKDLAKTLKQQLGIHALRVIGDPDASVSTLGLSEGCPGFESNRYIFQRKGVDVLVIGEAREWETYEYAADAITAKNRKGLIALGHIPSEQSGMEECTRWLRTFIKEVPVEFVPAKEPFWIPE
jgi:putative NIF3 family GTP cyclohydrolase 1 type 2